MAPDRAGVTRPRRSIKINVDKSHSSQPFNASDLNRYGKLVSNYLCEKSREDRKQSELARITQLESEVHLATRSEVDSVRKALRINIAEDDIAFDTIAFRSVTTKVCNTYIPAACENLNASTPSLLANPPCCCGRKKEDQVHKKEGRSKEWNSRKHTESIPTEVWGKLELAGGLADVLQLSDETDVTQLEKVLFGSSSNSSSNFKKPGVIVSLLGSVSELEMSERLEQAIERSLPKATAACDGWIISPGVNSGFGKIIGNGIRTNGLSLCNIGIISWGNLPVEVRMKMVKKANTLGSTIAYPASFNEHDPRHMEQNHTAFLMVDNGQIDSREAIDDVIKFRIMFENFLAEDQGVPLISVLNKGSCRTIQVLLSRLHRNDNIIILAKSGGLASFLQKVKEHIIWIRSQQSGYTKPIHLGYRKGSKSKVNCACMEAGAVKDIKSCSYITRKITKHITSLEHHPNSELFLEQMYTLSELAVEKEYNIFVFDVRDKMEFEQLLLNAMVEKSPYEKRLKYAFELGSPEVVEEMLLQADNLRTKNLTNLMIKAILMNRPTMVNLFLKTCSKSQLLQLKYNMPVLYDGACFAYGGGHLIRLISYHVSSSIVPGSSTSLGLFEPQTEVLSLAGKLPELWNQEAVTIIDRCINELAGQSFNYCVGYEEDTFFELTIWSVLMLRKEMALMFCQRAEDPIRCALLCLKLMLNLNRNKVIVNVEEDDKLSQLREAFESLALCNLEACYSTNPEMTFAAARCHWARVKNYDYLELAYEAECKRFIAHPACQDISERRWRVGFVKDEGFWTILLVVLFPPLILFPRLIEFDSFATHHQDGYERVWWDKIFVKLKIIGKSPMIKFLMNGVLSLAFIVLHLRVLYLDTNPVINRTVDRLSWTYIYLLLAWYCLLVIDEAIQVYQDKLYYWWKVVWNRLDLVIYTIYLIGLVLCIGNICTDDTGTCTLSTDMTGYVDCGGETGICDPSRAPYVHAGRILLSLVTVLMFLRCSMFISSDLTLGPIVLMLFEMGTTFAYFFVIFCVVLVGFGAAYIGLLVQVGQFSMERNVIGMVYYTYFQSLGELFLDAIEEPQSQYLNKADPARDMTDWRFKSDINASYYYVSLLLLVIFMIISNLMLLNILIAMFTESYERISSNQKTIWKFQRYSLMRDYENKFLPVPLSVIHYPLHVFRRVWKKFRPSKEYSNPLRSGIDKHLRCFVKEGLQHFIKVYGDKREMDSYRSKYDKYAIGL